MRRNLLGLFGAVCAVVAVGAAVSGSAPAASNPSATGSQAFVAGSATAIACGGSVDTTVTVTGQAGSTGTASDVLLVVDLSGSTGSDNKLNELKAAATATLAALDAADGTVDQTISGNAAGVEYYQGSSATVSAPIGSTYSALTYAIAHLPAPSGGSPHDVAINTAASALAASTDGYAHSLVLISDGQASGGDLTSTTAAADAAKSAHDTIVTYGIGQGEDQSSANLQAWATQSSYYQNATPGPINGSKAVADLGAAVATPVDFTATETLGSTFSATVVSTSTGTVGGTPTVLAWTGRLVGNQSATLVFHATRNGNDVFSPTSEIVGSLALDVSGGNAVVTAPQTLSIGVLPCGGTAISTTTCTGAQCTATGTFGGQQLVVDAGKPAAGTSVALTGLSTSPPPGVCPGLAAGAVGIQFDISPFTQTATFQYTIPKAALGTRPWFRVDVCLGTNLKFTTAIETVANLSPRAKLIGGGTVPGRYWGLLPSIPRFTLIPGLGYVKGPYISGRSIDRAGNVTVKFVVPFVPGSAAYTTDGKPGYDPKRWG